MLARIAAAPGWGLRLSSGSRGCTAAACSFMRAREGGWRCGWCCRSFPVQPRIQSHPEGHARDDRHGQHEDDAEVGNLVAVSNRTVKHDGRNDREDDDADRNHQKIARNNGQILALCLARRGAGSRDFVVLGGHDGSRGWVTCRAKRGWKCNYKRCDKTWR